MSENIQPSSEENQIVEDLSKEVLTEETPKFSDQELIINLEQIMFIISLYLKFLHRIKQVFLHSIVHF